MNPVQLLTSYSFGSILILSFHLSYAINIQISLKYDTTATPTAAAAAIAANLKHLNLIWKPNKAVWVKCQRLLNTEKQQSDWRKLHTEEVTNFKEHNPLTRDNNHLSSGDILHPLWK
jgi:hypothetical protein